MSPLLNDIIYISPVVYRKMKSYYALFSLALFMINESTCSQSIHFAKLMKSTNHLTKSIGVNASRTTEISSTSLTFSEKSTKISNDMVCESVHKSCSNRSQETSSSVSCSCRSDCTKYGDCCLDSRFEYGDPDTKVRCIVTGQDSYESYYMITQCPPYWNDNNTKLFCEIAPIYDKHFLNRVPVTNKNNLQTYRNIYCAICNNDKNVAAWIPHVSGNDSDQYYVSKYTPPKYFAPRRCNSFVNSTCNDSANRLLRRNCAKFYAPMKYIDSRGSVVFKNKFCAYCSGIKEINTLECSDGMTMTTTTTLKTVSSEENAVPFYFSFKFFNGVVTIEIEKCPIAMRQPWKNCHEFYCYGLFEYKTTGCLMKINRELNIDNALRKSVLNSTCRKITVSPNDYEAFEDGLVILKNQRGLQSGEYQIISSTNRSLLICDPLERKIYQLSKEQYHLIVICFSISAACLIIKLLLHFIGEKKNTLVTTAVFFLSLSLLLGQLLFLSSSGKVYDLLCKGIAVFKHYFFMVSIYCTNPIGLGIWRTFSNLRKCNQHQEIKTIPCIFYCWGVPLLIVTTTIINEWVFKSKFSPRYGSNLYNFCWISNRRGFLLFFAIPLLLVLIINIIFCISIGILIIKIPKSLKFAKDGNVRKSYLMFALFITLTLIIVFTWIVGFAASYSESEILWPPFIVMNSLQGVYLLFSFTNLDSLKNCFKKMRRKSRYNYNVRQAHAKSIAMEKI